jgi:hypothetical protein
MKKTACIGLAALLLGLVAPARGQEQPTYGTTNYPQGYIPSGGIPGPGPSISLWNGAAQVIWRGDAEGNAFMRDANPSTEQPQLQIMATNFRVMAGLVRMIGTSTSVSPYGYRALRIRRVTTGASSVPVVNLYLYGSHDDVTFFPLITKEMWVGGPNGTGFADTAKVDTVRAQIPTAGTGGVSEFKVTMPEDLYPGRYLAVYATAESVATHSTVLTVTFEGRKK